MFGLSTWELLIFAGVILVLFGANRLPGLMRNMGRSVNEFKAGIKEKPAELPSGEDQANESEQGG